MKLLEIRICVLYALPVKKIHLVYFSFRPQILEMNPEDEAEEDGANIDLDSQRKGKCVVLKTSTRQVCYFNWHNVFVCHLDFVMQISEFVSVFFL